MSANAKYAAQPVEWVISDTLVDYPAAVSDMETRVENILARQSPEMVWLLEHPPLYTAGTSAKPADLLDHDRFPTFYSSRGGQFTYHGPGQRIAYVMLNLKERALPGEPDVRQYVQKLEAWIIGTLAQFGVESFIRDGRVGVWTYDKKGRESKIAALGIRIRKWVTYHGIAINICPDLGHYTGIVPCGIQEYGVTSLADLGINAGIKDVDAALKAQFTKHFA